MERMNEFVLYHILGVWCTVNALIARTQPGEYDTISALYFNFIIQHTELHTPRYVCT